MEVIGDFEKSYFSVIVGWIFDVSGLKRRKVRKFGDSEFR